MWTTTVEFGATPQLAIRVWESASGCAQTTQDAWLVEHTRERVRLAALDGVTPTLATPRMAGLDGAAYAARLAAAALLGPGAATVALAAANADLYLRHRGLLHRDRPHAMAAVVDVGGDTLDVTVAGDCQVFVAMNGIWREMFGGPLWDVTTRRRWGAWRDADPHRHPVDEIADGYEDIIAQPERWRSTPIGLFAQPHFEHTTLAGTWEGVMVASDGARLTAHEAGRVDEWLAGLQNLERTEFGDEFKPHDDVVVIAAFPG